jgi:hypothetical protein
MNYFKFIANWGTYILLIFMLFFIGVGVSEVLKENYALGIGIIIAYSIIIFIYLNERYRKWKKLYK